MCRSTGSKIQGPDYSALADCVMRFDADRVATGDPGLMKTAALYREYGRTPRAFRADWLRAALRHCGRKIGHAHNDRNGEVIPIYDYANDDHIDTAMRRIIRDLAGGKCWASEK